MPDTIAQLDIQITSTAKSADDAVTKLQDKVSKLGSALSVLNVSATGLSTVANDITAFKDAVNSIDAKKMADVSNAVKKLSAVAGSITTTGVANISTLTTALRDLSTLTFSGDIGKVASLFNSLSRLSGTTIDPAMFTSLGDGLANLQRASANAPAVADNVVMMLTALTKLGSARMASVPATLDAISAAISRMVVSFNALPMIRDDILRFVEALSTVPSRLGSVASAVRRVADETGTSSGRLDEFLTGVRARLDELATSGHRGAMALSVVWDTIAGGSEKVKAMTSSLAGAVDSIKSKLAGMANVAKNAFSPIINGFNSLKKALMGGPVGTMLRFAATFFTIQKAWEALKSSIANASALVEIQNVINAVYSSSEKAFTSMSGGAQTAAEHLDELAEGAIHAYGMSELAFKQYASRFQAMGTALGITNEQVANAEANLDKWGVMVSKVKDPVTGLNKEFGTMTGQMSDMSMTLVQLSGDIASFYDKDVGDIQQMLASGIYGGQTRPLRALGLDLTQANVQAWALSQGLNADMQTMTQSEKVMLRYQYVLSSLGFVMGDFAYTADTFANRWRVLQQQMIQFGSTVGTIFINAFKPVLRVLNRVMDAAIQFAETVLNALGAIFGWTYEISGAGITDDLGEMATDMGDVASGAGDTASGLGDAAKNAAKLKTQLQSFDRLNNLSSPGNTGSGGSGGSGGGGGGGAGGAGGGSGALQIARHTGEGIIKAYESAIKDLEGLGRYISTSLRDALRNVDWDKVYAGAESFGAGLAKFLNGLIRPDTFYEVGRAIANSLNTVLRSALSFADNFNFKNLGESINAEFLGFFQNFDWDTAKKAVKSWAKGFADIINGFISPDMFKEMGKALAELLSTIWGGLNSFFKELDFSEFGPALVAAIVGFLTNVDWIEIVNSLLATIESAFELLLGLVVGVVEEIPWRDIWEGIKNVLGEFDLNDALKGVMSLGEKVGKWIGEGIEQFFRDHPRLQILADVLGIHFEDDIPQGEKVAEDGTLEVEHAHSSHLSPGERTVHDGIIEASETDQRKMPLEAKLVRDGKMGIVGLDQSGLSSDKKKVTNGQMGVSSVYSQLSAAAKKKGWGLAASVASLWAAGNMKKSYDWKLTSSVKSVYKATSGFTGFTLSGTIKGGGGKVTATMKKDGGVYDKGKWSDIPKFADGGVPSVAYGSLFWAGEAGPELVGHVGGRTEVLNASQIAVAVSDGVARANNSVVNALAAQNRILVGILEKKTGISSRDIFTAVRAEAANYQLRTGTPAFQ